MSGEQRVKGPFPPGHHLARAKASERRFIEYTDANYQKAKKRALRKTHRKRKRAKIKQKNGVT
jgi:hypothetical protein